jgi:hypothetical protein
MRQIEESNSIFIEDESVVDLGARGRANSTRLSALLTGPPVKAREISGTGV